ncbi:uncharacterized protein LOC131256700 isoform X2 [Magnolia sinica]|uniref:uncharacterized protein LOC131256700 isoform X2 n=1 Tax=Magnolia sinica TaxID=86752 RepID=UPI002657F776|nr:uncharacterized protein LOC131256700 isoform X2 [Magnolia sinica]
MASALHLNCYSISAARTSFIPTTYNTIRSISIYAPHRRIRTRTSHSHTNRQPLILAYKNQIEKSIPWSIGLGSTPDLCFRWLKYFNFSGRLAYGFVGIFFLSLNFVAEAHDNAALSLRYACEDVSHYYSHVERMEGAALMKELNSIVSHHQSLPYKEVWNALKILDAADVDDPEASSDVVEIYSLRAVSKSLAGKPEGWNREHLWPRSYGLTDGPSLTDLHNIRPADVNVNSSRGNKYYGECASYSKDCLKPASNEAASDTETDKKRWAPPLQVRGDIARSLMYMSVRYGFSQPSGSPNLQLSDSPSIERREMGLLSALLRWNELDPPSRAEQLRNDRICRLYQHNRNPFVDHPEFANLIWKHAIPSSLNVYNSSNAWINEFHYNNKGKDYNEFVEILVGPSTSAAALELVLYNGANGKMYKSLPLADERAFTAATVGNSGFLIYTAFVPLQNGPGDGIALISGTEDGSDREVVQFLSYDGVVKAIDGPAKGTVSVDIKVHETAGSSQCDSVGLTGRIGKFKWGTFIDGASPGKLNIGQNLLDP